MEHRLIDYTIYPLGDAALSIDFGNVVDKSINEKVISLFQQLQHMHPAILDVVPCYSSLTIFYDVMQLHTGENTSFDELKNILTTILKTPKTNSIQPARAIEIPVCYSGHFAPDLKDVADKNNLSVEEVIHIHTATSYRVYMLGFLPGFPYMGEVDDKIAKARKAEPVAKVAAGSVGIAGKQTGIYSLESPGGWQIIGRTPIQLFDKKSATPALLQPGDEVTFYSITEDEFESIKSRPT